MSDRLQEERRQLRLEERARLEERLQGLEERTQRLLEIESRPWWHNEFAALSVMFLVVMVCAIVGMLVFAM